MFNMNITVLSVFLFCTALHAGDIVVQALSERQKLLDAAKEDYEKKTAEINSSTIEKLSVILRKSIAAKNFKDADEVGKAIMEIQKPVRVSEDSPSVPSATGNSIVSASGDEDFPDGAFRKFGHHYKLLPFKMTRSDAVKTCESLGGHLLDTGDAGEYAFFFELAKKEKKQIWLDLNRKKGEGEWLAWDGKTASFLKWFDGKYNEDSHSDAVVMNVNNSGVDMVRVNGAKFACFVICEWEK